ncbi:MAG: diadenylate cyclase [Bacilli bacterium]|jgi:diadenylate cyclase
MINFIPVWSDWTLWLDLGLSLLVFSILLVIIGRVAKRKIYLLPFGINIAAIIVADLFTGISLFTLALIFNLLVFTLIFVFVNIASVRPFINNLFLNRKPLEPVSRRYDRDQLLNAVVDTVAYLSKTKTGAIIAIERKSNLGEFIKNGTPMNAPVSSELLMTIFYPGTRLHDGAVVLRDNMIIAASVYFPPTTKPLSGKYGSRHRAALGISEVSDAVVVVVSEETGRISFAYNGELEAVFIDQFKQVLIHYMEIAHQEKD